MGDPFDPDGLRISAPLSAPVNCPRLRPPAGGKFLKGPIPMAWIETALTLPGRALAVGVLLWFEAGCARTDAVDITYARLGRRGLPESTARRGLRALESAGLVCIERRAGRALRVTIRRPSSSTNSTPRG
jgi:hypothetical protein